MNGGDEDLVRAQSPMAAIDSTSITWRRETRMTADALHSTKIETLAERARSALLTVFVWPMKSATGLALERQVHHEQLPRAPAARTKAVSRSGLAGACRC